MSKKKILTVNFNSFFRRVYRVYDEIEKFGFGGYVIVAHELKDKEITFFFEEDPEFEVGSLPWRYHGINYSKKDLDRAGYIDFLIEERGISKTIPNPNGPKELKNPLLAKMSKPLKKRADFIKSIKNPIYSCDEIEGELSSKYIVSDIRFNEQKVENWHEEIGVQFIKFKSRKTDALIGEEFE